MADRKLRPEFVNWRRGAVAALVVYCVCVVGAVMMAAWRVAWP